MADTKRTLMIKEAAGLAHWKLLQCPNCFNSVASSFEQDFKYTWSLKLKCYRCNTCWWVCKECQSLRSHLTTKTQTTRHNRIKHKEDPTVEVETVNAVTVNTSTSPMISNQFFVRPASLAFFQAAQEGKGNDNLVLKAVGLKSLDTRVEAEDKNMVMSLAHFIGTLTRSQRDNFATVLAITTLVAKRHALMQVKVKTEEDKKMSGTNKAHIIVPTSKQEIRRIFCEGKNAIFPNLPHPEVYVMDNHAYVLPSECLADLTAHGLLDVNVTTDLHPVETLAECPLAQELDLNNEINDCRSVFFSLWSDDFEPNYSKGNRGSVWIATLTIQTRESGNPSVCQVYPLCVGPKGSNHDNVMAKVFEDIAKLSNRESKVSMYNGKKKVNENISAHLICITQDQPERRSFAGLLLGGKGHHARWGHSCKVSKLTDKLPPCNDCLDRMQLVTGDDEWIPHRCSQCYNFWQFPEDMFCAHVDDDFPNDLLDANGNEKGNKCLKLSYAQLQAAAILTHNQIGNQRWNKGTACAYLRRFCLNQKAQDDIVECATNCRILQKAIEENDQPTIMACDRVKQVDPDKFEQWKPPPVWRSLLNMQQSTEPCMHLFFLGLVKNMLFEIQDWASLCNKYASMRRQLEEMTVQVESLHLSWCKVQPYRGERLGGWVSENFGGFSRILLWVYSSLLFLSDDSPFEPPPDKPIGRWTIEECKAFLRPRRVNLSGTVAELQEKVRANKDTQIPPPVGGPVGQIRNLLLTLWQMISHLMGMEKVDDRKVNVAERLIRLFLASLTIHDETMRNSTERKDPIWITQYNCQCLLNIPEQLKILGPVRNRWEGGRRGEGFLRVVKPIVQSGRKNWQKNLLLNLLRQKTLKQMELLASNSVDLEEDSTRDEDNSSDPESQYHEQQMFVLYGTQGDILGDFVTRQPLSGLVVANASTNKYSIYCCYRLGTRKLLQEITLLEETAEYHFGMWYQSTQLTIEEFEETDNAPQDDIDLLSLEEVSAESYCILLPLVKQWPPGSGRQETPMYTIVCSNWRVLSENGNLVLPHMYTTKELYSV